MKLIYLAGVSLLALSGPCLAQTGSPEPRISDIEEVVVTARRREESAQTVPISVTALSATALAERQVHSLGDLTNAVPGLRFTHQGGGGNMNVVLRGLARIPLGDSPNAVVNYFADVPLNFNGSNVPIFDLASIQVLKGPQGTLFGRNTIGGAIIFTPTAPSSEWGGYLTGSAGNFDYRDVEGAINIPVFEDKIAIRLAGKSTRRDGYTKNITGRGDLDDIHRDSVRASLLLTPTANIRNLTVFDRFTAKENGVAGILWNQTPGGLARTPALARFFDCHTVNSSNPVACVGFQPDADIDDAFARQQAWGPRTTATSIEPRLDRKIWGVSNKTEVDFGAVQARSIFGYRKTFVSSDFDSDGVNFTPPLIDPSSRVDLKSISEEVHLLGTAFDSKLDWIVGGIYIKEDPDGPNGGRFRIASSAVPWITSFSVRENKALFGQIGLSLGDWVDGLKLNAGYRYSWDEANACTVAVSGLTFNPAVDQDSCPTTAGRSFISYKGKAPTWTLGLDWQVRPDLFVYATTRRGYREGNINSPAFLSPATAILLPYQTFRPELVTDVEVGVKHDWRIGDVTGRVNVSAYRSKYENVVSSFMVGAIVPSTDPSVPLNNAVGINSGQRTLSGFEWELIVRPVESLTLTSNGAYTHQRVDSLTLPPVPGINVPAFGNNSPKWSTTASARWVLPVAPLDGEVIVRGDYSWQGDFYVGNAVVPAYDVANARIEWNDIAGKGVSAAAFIRNIMNDADVIAGGVTTLTIGIQTAAYSEPRMYGLELSYRW
ncbi:MAG: TonB-dependent receptor [Devosia sp.]|uniref:TonB-dependent receptor n=1 Tax=Devosia sp. TaxID=1871048 RepID=UPI0026019918|nr:TonB-dependent receptor [Devosia sp.]MDB5540584.1 TonB-dependent receptor [Devosia sp.]